MSSLKMHMAISKKVKEELQLGDLFLVGSILPDVLKLILHERKLSHFEIDQNIDLNKFLLLQDNFNEIVLGYYAHLIEDKIWFELYMNRYRKLEIYSDDRLYNDYAFIDNYMYKKLKIKTEDISKILFDNMNVLDVKSVKLMNWKNEDLINNKSVKEKIKEIWKDYEFNNINYFYTMNDAKEYYELASKKVKEYIIKYVQ